MSKPKKSTEPKTTPPWDWADEEHPEVTGVVITGVPKPPKNEDFKESEVDDA